MKPIRPLKQSTLLSGGRKRISKNPMGSKLYHVTSATKALLIKRNGFDPNFLPSEGGKAQVEAERILADNDDEDYDDYGFETPVEVRTREVFDEILASARPDGSPGHGDSVFFWSDRQHANDTKIALNSKDRVYGPYITLPVYGDRIPCRCYEADFQKVEDLFSDIESNIDMAEGCTGAGSFAPQDEDEEKELDTVCNGLKKIAKEYYATMVPFTGKPDHTKEILCPCPIKPTAIDRTKQVKLPAVR